MNKKLWMEKALNMGISELEIYQSRSIEKECTWYDHQVDTLVSSNFLGTSIRGIYNGKMANVALESVDDEKMEEILQSLIDQAKTISIKESDEIRKPVSMELVKHHKHFKMAAMSDVQETLKLLEEKMLAYDPRVFQVSYLGYSQAKGDRSIVNTYGMDLYDEDEIQYFVAQVSVNEDDDIQNAFEADIVYDLSDWNIDQFVAKVCDKALKKLNAKPIKSIICPVIFEKDAMTSLFSSFVDLFNGDLVYKGISALKQKENTKIFSDKITIIDDPRNLDAMSIANFDDEGCPTRSKILVDQGVLKTFLHSTRSASRMNTESTGNGFKSSYASSVGVHPMNCYIKPGEDSMDALCEKIKDGMVIQNLQGLHAGLDFVSTDFSLQCQGYWVKDGKRAQNVTLVTVAGNYLEMMQHVLAVGNDLDWSYHQICTPSIAFEKCSISGE